MISFKSLRHALLMGVATVGGVATVSATTQPAYAQEATRIYNIDAQDLNSALRQFAIVTGRDVLYPPEIVANKRSPGAHGQLSEHDALQALLAGSGLQFTQTASNGYAVQDPSSPTRLGDASGAAPSDDAAVSEMLVVTGHRTLNADIRRTESGTQPYVVFSGDEIQQSGAASVEEFLRLRLPMNAQQEGQNQTIDNTSSSNNGRINLRGLGSNQTLILVDGRRIASVSDGSDLNQPNIIGIPPSAIERIDILPSTASGIYGGGATGGVINIVLKRDYTGLDLQASYGSSFRGDAASGTFNLNGGFSLEGGKTRILVGAVHSEQDPLYVDERDLALRARRLASSNVTQVPLMQGALPNIRSSFPFPNLVLDDGTALNSSTTHVSLGYSGPSGDDGAGLAQNAGQQDLNPAPGSSAYLQGVTTNSYSLNVHRDFSPHIEAFLDLYTDRTVLESDASPDLRFSLPASSPFNPFQQDVDVFLPGLVTTHSESSIENRRANAGVIAHLPGNWDASLEYDWSQSTSTTHSSRATGLSASGAALLSPFAFGSPDLYPTISADDYTSQVFDLDPSDNTMADTVLRFSGPLANLPAGPITLTGLVEHREETAASTYTFFDLGFFSDLQWHPEATQNVNSAYAEIRVPLVSANYSLPLIRSLELTGALRRDEYETSTVGNVFSVASRSDPHPPVNYQTTNVASTDYTIGVRYSPVNDIVLRASHGTGFLPPRLFQLVSFPQDAFASDYLGVATDPRRGNSDLTGDPNTGLIHLITGGNPDLAPEQSESTSYGIIWTPSFVDGLRVSLDFTEIEKTGEAAFLSDQFFIDNESIFPGRIVRGANLPGDQPGWAGPIVQINDSWVNISKTLVKAVDFQIDYTLDTERVGTWRFYLIGTRQTAFERQALPTTSPFDTVGFADGPLEWRGNFGIDWQLGQWQLNWNAQYYDSYSIQFGDPASADSNSALVTLQGSRTVPSQIYHDLIARYRFEAGQGLLSETDVTFGIYNLFDERPPILAGFAGSGYSQYGDPRLRRFALTVRKHF